MRASNIGTLGFATALIGGFTYLIPYSFGGGLEWFLSCWALWFFPLLGLTCWRFYQDNGYLEFEFSYGEDSCTPSRRANITSMRFLQEDPDRRARRLIAVARQRELAAAILPPLLPFEPTLGRPRQTVPVSARMPQSWEKSFVLGRGSSVQPPKLKLAAQVPTNGEQRLNSTSSYLRRFEVLEMDTAQTTVEIQR